MAKNLATLRKLADNPFYAMTPEDKLELTRLEKEESQDSQNSKKKLSRSVSGNAVVREIGKIEMHPHGPDTE